MAVTLTTSIEIGSCLFDLTKSLLDKSVDVDGCYQKFKSLINARFIDNKTIDGSELKAVVNLSRFGGSTPLWAAIREDNLEIAEYLLKLGADPNLTDPWFRLSSLHHAATFGFHKMIDLLMRYGADIHAAANDGKTPLHAAAYEGHTVAMKCLMGHGAKIDLLDSDKCTAGYYIRSHGLPETEALFPIDAITSEIVARQFLAHVHGIGGTTNIVAGQKMELAGFHIPIVCQTLLPYLTEFGKSLQKNGVDAGHYSEVLRAFHFCAYARSPEEYLQRAQSGELTFIPTGWGEHAVVVGLKRDIAATLNKGEGVTADRKPIQAFPIDKTKLTIDNIKAILDANSDMDLVEGQEFFYQTLPQRLSPSQSAKTQKLCDDLRSLYTPKLIDVGTCTYAGLKVAMQFGLSVLALLKHPNQPYRNVERLSQIKTFCSQFSTFCRLKSIRDYLIKHFGDVLDKDLKTIAKRIPMSDMSLVERAWFKVNQRLAKDKHRRHPLSEKEKTFGNQINDMIRKIRAAKGIKQK